MVPAPGDLLDTDREQTIWTTTNPTHTGIRRALLLYRCNQDFNIHGRTLHLRHAFGGMRHHSSTGVLQPLVQFWHRVQLRSQ